MLNFLIPLGLMASGMLGAVAANTEDVSGEVSVAPGLWNWSHDTTLAEFHFQEENTECLPEDRSRISLNDIAREFQENPLINSCTVGNIAKTSDGYNFTLTCDGALSGVANGKVVKSDEENIAVSAVGSVAQLGKAGNFSFNATATRVGQCPATSG